MKLKVQILTQNLYILQHHMGFRNSMTEGNLSVQSIRTGLPYKNIMQTHD